MEPTLGIDSTKTAITVFVKSQSIFCPLFLSFFYVIYFLPHTLSTLSDLPFGIFTLSLLLFTVPLPAEKGNRHLYYNYLYMSFQFIYISISLKI